MGIFDGLKSAKSYERGTYLLPGVYRVQIKRIITKKVRKGYDAVITELKVIECKTPGGNAAGTSATWFQGLGDIDIGFSALKGFAAGITGSDPEDPAFCEQVEDFMKAAVADGALNGLIVPVEVVQIKTRADKDFSLHKWGKAEGTAPA